jgi:hypothetical protein
MIPEPQRTYLLELLAALGAAASDFVIAGAQAIKFAVKDARGTKDVDFILNVIALRAEPLQLDAVLKRLGYTAVAGARNFQFEKSIPNSRETMRIEFMARKNSSAPPISASMCSKGFTPAPVPAEASRLPNRTSTRWKERCRTAGPIAQECASPGPMRW